MMANAVANQENKSVSRRVEEAVQKQGMFESLLPAQYRPMADRMLKRAQLYIASKPELQSASVASLTRCVLQAGEWGMCLDGRMAYAVKFGQDAVFMPSFVGILDMARRHGCVVDAYCHHVHENDEFRYSLENGQWQLTFAPNLSDRGDYIGTFVCLILDKSGRYMPEYMTAKEIDAIRNRSKAKSNGPWVTDWMEMAKKTVIKRALKRYVSDPEVSALLDHDNENFGLEELGGGQSAAPARAVTARSLTTKRQDALPPPIDPSVVFADAVSPAYPEHSMAEAPVINEPPPDEADEQDDNSAAFRDWDIAISECDDATELTKMAADIAADPKLNHLAQNQLAEQATGKARRLKGKK